MNIFENSTGAESRPAKTFDDSGLFIPEQTETFEYSLLFWSIHHLFVMAWSRYGHGHVTKTKDPILINKSVFKY